MDEKQGMTYEGAGLSYAGLDDFKKDAQASASETNFFASRLGVSVLDWTRGESVFVAKLGDQLIGFTVEGLGTKNEVERKFREALAIHEGMPVASHASFANKYAQCCVAMIVNDKITLGVLPAVIGMHPAVASDEWFKDELRSRALIDGWQHACELSGAVWGPGETPGLKDIIVPGTVCLSGAAWGVAPYGLFDPSTITDGDTISFLTSSGPHANGYTLYRKIADGLPNGYRSVMPNGQMYGDALLEPTHIYVKFIEECMKAGVQIRYGVNITGHGWRKLMRAPGNFEYLIKKVPKLSTVFRFIQEQGNVSDRESFGNFNMDVGFAIYTPPSSVPLMKKVWREGNYPFDLIGNAGVIRASDRKSVNIEPLGFEPFTADELDMR